MTFDSKFSEILNIEETPKQEVLAPEVKPVEEKKDSIVEDDYEYARNNLRDLIDHGMSDLETVMELGRSSESARVFEVGASMMKNLVDANKDLLDLAKKKKDITQEKSDKPQNVTNALFVGSTAELQNLIQGKTDGSRT